MLNVDKFVVNRNLIKKPEPSQVHEVLYQIFENEHFQDTFELTKAVSSALPKEKALSFWPHVDLNEPWCLSYNDSAYIFASENLKSFGTNIRAILSGKIDSCIKNRTIKPKDRRDIISILKYLFNTKQNFNGALGQGLDRENGLGMATRVYDAEKYAIKTTHYSDNFYYMYTPDFDNMTLLQQNYPKLKTYKGTVILRTKNLKFLENVGEHIQAGTDSFMNYTNKDELLDYYKNTYLKRFSQVPQESFDDIAMDFATLNRDYSKDGKYTSFAFENPNNIILKDDKLYLVDELIQNCSIPNTLSDYLYNMLGIIHQYNAVRFIDYGDSMPFAQDIFKKILKSGTLAQLPITAENAYCKKIFEQVLQNLKIKTPADSVIKELERIKSLDKNARIEAVEKYADEILLTGKLEE